MWQTIAGKIWSTSKTKKDDGVELGQFIEADLTKFHNTLRALAVQVSTVSGLSLHNLGYSSDNPPSADGIRAAESRHVKRAERRIKGFENAWERRLLRWTRCRQFRLASVSGGVEREGAGGKWEVVGG
ncbi:hypothetical protein ACWDKQ_36235 [Saccharopolyspora sp. NPDC000995]